MNAPAYPPFNVPAPSSEALQWQPGELTFARLDQALEPSVREALIQNLLQVLPAESVIQHAEGLKPYECDGLSGYRHLPAVVVLPYTEQQASQVLAICHARNIPVVARGAGTGLSGGGDPAQLRSCPFHCPS